MFLNKKLKNLLCIVLCLAFTLCVGNTCAKYYTILEAGNFSLNISAGPSVTFIDYIKNTNTAWLDTGLTINKTDSAEYVLYCNLSNTSWGGANAYLQFNMQGLDSLLNTWTEVRVVYDGSTHIRSLYINGEFYGSNDWSSLNWNNVKIGIFALGDKDNTWYSQQPQIGLVKSCKIYKNGKLVRDYIAAKNKQNTYGLYDRINAEFHESDGYTAFTGPA